MSVVSLSGAPLSDPRKPDEAVVEQARFILEMAESGEIGGIAAIVLHRDGAISRLRAGEQTHSVVGGLYGAMNAIIEELE